MIPGRGGESFPTDAVQTVAGVVESRQILRAEKDEMKEAATDDNVRRWEDHTRALRLYFGRTPGLQSGGDQSSG